MISTREAMDRLVLHEGLVLKPYRCPAGYLTIGVGRNLDTNPLTPEESRACGDYKHGITKNAAMLLLKNDIERLSETLGKKVLFWPYLSDERQYALLDMAFNLGINGLFQFKKMLGCMSVADFKGAAKECLDSKYAKDVGQRAKRISTLIETGKWVL